MKTVTTNLSATKLLFVALLTFLGLTMHGQTYTITNSSLNVGNPGGVRTSGDYLNSGGSQVINGATGSATRNYWSDPVAIPFTFKFADSVMTHFIVNKNGLMTFDTTAAGTQVPSSMNVNTSLPNASLPDNTIAFFWEDTSSTSVSSSDYVYVNVEGTSPNRQLWIRYYSFRIGSQSYCYWGCVLEETSNKFYVVDMNYGSSTANYTGTVGVQLNSTTAWEVSTPLNGTNGSPNIRMGTGSSGAADNEYYEFSFLAAGACVPPLNPTAGSITSSGATIVWTPGTGNGSVVEYGATGFTPGSGTNMYVTDTSAILTGLTANTTYDVYVKDSCTNNSSTWAGPATFTTLCSSQISGTVTINPLLPASSTNFQSFNALATEINGCGISGALTVNVSPGTYNEQVMFMDIVGASAANNIVINGGGATISYDGANTQNSTIQLNGTDHMTIKNLTITNTESSSYGWGIHLTNGADSNTVDSCTININQTSTSSSFAGIISSNSNTSTGSYGNNANYTMISNTTINGGYYGVRFNGGSTSSFNSGNMVHNCTFTENRTYTTYFIYQDGPTVTDNSFSWRASATSSYGVYLNNSRHGNVQRNTINGARTYGLYLYNNNTSSQSPTQRVLLANNMITVLSYGDGIYLSGSDQVDIFHNSITAENDQALWINSSSDDFDVRNNIFSISGSTYVIDLDAAPDSTTDVLDYNIYHNSGTGSIAQVVSTNYATLAAWQTGDPGQNVSSLEGDPVFTNATDLHVIGNLANDVGDNTVGILVDIDGETRPASGSTTVDIGADEYTASSCSPPSGLAFYNVTNSSATAYWTTGGASSWILQYGTSGFTPGSGTFMLATNDTTVISGLMAQTTYDVYVKDSCGTSTSPWSGPVSFTTLCDPATAPYTENFDSLALTSPYTALPDCWDPQTGPDFWDVTNDVVNTGHTYLPNIGDHTSGTTNYMWIDASSNITGNAMVTGLIDMSTLTTPFAGFWFASNNTTNTINHTISLDAWDGTNWVNVTTESGNFTGWVEVSGVVPANVPDTTKFRIQAIADPNGTSSTYYFNDLGVDDFFVMEAPNCPAPSGLSLVSVSSTDATLSWTPGGTATNWMVQYDTAGFTPGTGNFMASSNDTTTISGLMAQTSYDVYVKDSCSVSSTSAWIGPLSFTTLCNPFTAPYTESFDTTVIPDCWSQTAVSGGPWLFSGSTNSVNCNAATDHTGNGGSYTWMDQSGSDASVSLVMGVVDVSTLTVPYLEFYYWMCGAGYSPPNVTIVEAYNGSTWTVIDSITTATVGWEKFNYVLSSYTYGSNLVQIRFRAESGGSGSDFYGDNALDDITIKEAPTCPQPTNLGAFNITATSADVFWTTGGASYYQIEYGPSGFTQGTGMMMTVSNDTVSLASLLANTAYDLYVRDSCGATDLSVWSGPITFNTLCNTFTAPFTEGFEGMTNSCWSQEYVSGSNRDWIFATGSSGGAITTANSGSLNARHTSSSGGPHVTALISPVIDASGLTSPQLDFAYAQEQWAGDQCNLTVYYRDSTNGPWMYLWADSTNQPAWTNATVSVPSTSPTLQLNFTAADNWGRAVVVDDVVLAEAPTCPDPTALGAFNITSNSAQVFWTGSGSGLGYLIEYGPAGFTPGTGLTMPSANDTATISGLMANMAYDFYVQDSCGSTLLSNVAGPFTFNTLCNTFTAPFLEDFEVSTGTTGCWSQEYVTGTNDWTFATGSSGGTVTAANSGTLNARFTSSSGGPYITRLISPVIDASTLTGTQLTFAYAQENWAGDQNFLNVYYRDSANGAWNLVFSDSTNKAAWTPEDVILPSTSATLQVAFEAVDNWGRAVVVDDVEIKQAPSCPPSTNLGVTNVTSTSVDLYWTSVSNASYFIVEYGPVGFIPCTGIGNVTVANNDTVNISNLLPNTAYEFYVIDSCGVGNTAGCPGAGPYLFSTLCNTFTAPFFEDFETATGTSGCWTQSFVNGNNDWTFATGSSGGTVTTAYSGSLNARHTSSSGGPHITVLISPVIDASALTSPTLSFAYAQEDWAGDQNFLNVYYRDSTNGAWNYLWSDSTNQAAWTTAMTAVPSTSSTLQLGFEGVDNWGRAVVLDDVSLADPSVCSDPDSIMVTAGCTDATIMWSSEAGASTSIEYGPSGFTQGNGSIMNGITSPLNLSNLTMGMSYDFYLLDTCANNAASNWTSVTTFTTDTMPIAAFNANMNAAPHPDTVQYGFSAQPSVGANSYWWDYGDGSANDTGAVTIHNYGMNGTYTVTLVATNQCGSDTTTQQIVVQGISVGEFGLGNFSLYPNPNDGVFTVTGMNNFGDRATLEVINSIGMVIYVKTFNASSQQTLDIDLRGMAPGLYQLRIRNERGVGVKPFVIRN